MAAVLAANVAGEASCSLGNLVPAGLRRKPVSPGVETVVNSTRLVSAHLCVQTELGECEQARCRLRLKPMPAVLSSCWLQSRRGKLLLLEGAGPLEGPPAEPPLAGQCRPAGPMELCVGWPEVVVQSEESLCGVLPMESLEYSGM